MDAKADTIVSLAFKHGNSSSNTVQTLESNPVVDNKNKLVGISQNNTVSTETSRGTDVGVLIQSVMFDTVVIGAGMFQDSTGLLTLGLKFDQGVIMRSKTFTKYLGLQKGNSVHSIAVPVKLFNKLEELAQKKNISRNALVNLAILDFVEDKEYMNSLITMLGDKNLKQLLALNFHEKAKYIRK